MTDQEEREFAAAAAEVVNDAPTRRLAVAIHDVHVLSDEGREVEVREEDDELLRAAEELGIDLSAATMRAASRAKSVLPTPG